MSRSCARTVATCPSVEMETGVRGRGSSSPPGEHPAGSTPAARTTATTAIRGLTRGAPSGEALLAVVGLDELVGGAQAAQPGVGDDGVAELFHVALAELRQARHVLLRGPVGLDVVDELQR